MQIYFEIAQEGMMRSSAETPKCWSLQFQTEAILAENLDIYGKLSLNMVSVWT